MEFNASKLNIQDVAVYSETQKSQETQTVKTGFDQKTERATVQVTKNLQKGGKAQVRVWYDAKLTDDLMGTSYVDSVQQQLLYVFQATTCPHMRITARRSTTL